MALKGSWDVSCIINFLALKNVQNRAKNGDEKKIDDLGKNMETHGYHVILQLCMILVSIYNKFEKSTQ